MSQFTKDVLKISTRSKGKNSWKVLTTKAEDGKEREENIIISGDRELQEKVSSVFDVTGKYEIEYEKRGEYWIIVGARKLEAAQQHSKEQKPQELHAPSPHMPSDAMLAHAALNAASILVGEMVKAGKFQDASVDQIQAFALESFDAFVTKANTFVHGKCERMFSA